mmetsp:Transcript_10403/g.63509  ORF Transcript_10403/g.63509 Transcript_10403/m.63509 type:complete len:100 (+) Transcript_10403:7793-8092(+)
MDLHRPSAESIPAIDTTAVDSGTMLSDTPDASASLFDVSSKLSNANLAATMEDEHAVSIVAAGPTKPKVKEILPAAILPEEAVKEKGVSFIRSCEAKVE